MKKVNYNIWDYIIHGIYFCIYGFVKYIPSPVGDIFRYWISKLFVYKMGKVRLYEGVTLWYPYRIKIGQNVTLNEHVYISGYGQVSIGNNVSIGHRTSIISSDHIFISRECTIKNQGLVSKPVLIGNDVFIGCNVTIIGGVTIGNGVVIGAGSVVTKDIEPYSIVAGNPARTIEQRI